MEIAHAIVVCIRIAGNGAPLRQVTTEVQRGKRCCGNCAAPCEQPNEDKPIVHAQHNGAKMTCAEIMSARIVQW